MLKVDLDGAELMGGRKLRGFSPLMNTHFHLI